MPVNPRPIRLDVIQRLIAGSNDLARRVAALERRRGSSQTLGGALQGTAEDAKIADGAVDRPKLAPALAAELDALEAHETTQDGRLDALEAAEAAEGSGGRLQTVYGYAQAIGDGASTSYAITHGLGTTDVLCQLRTASGGLVVDAELEIVDADTVQVSFRTAPAAAAYRLAVLRCAPPAGSYSTLLGDGSASEFTVTHGLGSADVLVELYDAASGLMVDEQVEIVDADTVQVSFRTAPAADAYRLVVLG